SGTGLGPPRGLGGKTPRPSRAAASSGTRITRCQGAAVPHFLFVTGKLAEPSLRRVLAAVAPRVGFEYTVVVLPITVVALAATCWIARPLQLSGSYDRVVLPGLCSGEMAVFAGIPVERGPADLRDLPEFFGSQDASRPDGNARDIAILAEINHAPRLALSE